MEIEEMQKKSFEIIEKYNAKNSLEHNKNTVFPHFVEEVGELAREYNHGISNWRKDFSKEKFAEEWVDVLIQLLNLATDFEIDIEDAFNKKINELKNRFELD
jgi:NTP pyrophosphatase (non-canonical NTP hydrolase)